MTPPSGTSYFLMHPLVDCKMMMRMDNWHYSSLFLLVWKILKRIITMATMMEIYTIEIDV